MLVDCLRMSIILFDNSNSTKKMAGSLYLDTIFILKFNLK